MVTNTAQFGQDGEAIQRIMTVPVSPERAFAIFTEELTSWWPAEYTWPCGFASDPENERSCSLSIVKNYQTKKYGPLMDRIDIDDMEATAFPVFPVCI